MSRALLVLILAALLWWLWPAPVIRHPPGVLVPIPPVQGPVQPQPLTDFKGYHLEAQASYVMQARVLRTKRYYAEASDLVPYDVALGWGPMSDQQVLDRLHISQSNRFFFYEWRDQPPISPGQMASNAANVHIISADAEVAKAVRGLHAGQIVTLKGFLVNVTRADGFHWNSSLTRDDTGNGACEVFYVQAIRVTDRPSMPPAPAPKKSS